MSTSTATRTPDQRQASPHPLVPRLLGAVLALCVAYIHINDQGGFPGDKMPTYVGLLYYVLEAAGLVVALALLVGGRRCRQAWVLALGVALGPIAGYVWSRGPGMPDYTDDKGNWTEPIGVLSLVLEGLLLLLALAGLARSRRATVR